MEKDRGCGEGQRVAIAKLEASEDVLCVRALYYVVGGEYAKCIYTNH